MPDACKRACDFPRCPKMALPGRWLCEDHNHQRSSELENRKPKNPAVIKFYNSVAWRKLRIAFKARNPLCQVIDDNGIQCTKPWAATHHLLPHNGDPNVGLDWKYLVAICSFHHAPTPGETENRNFADTIGMFGDVFPHPRVAAGEYAYDRPATEPLFYTSAFSQNEKPAPAPTRATWAESKVPPAAPVSAPAAIAPAAPRITWATQVMPKPENGPK